MGSIYGGETNSAFDYVMICYMLNITREVDRKLKWNLSRGFVGSSRSGVSKGN